MAFRLVVVAYSLVCTFAVGGVYKLNFYPNNGLGCEAEAKTLAKRLAASGLTVEKASCRGETDAHYKLSIQYAGSSQISDTEDTPTDGRGVYETLQECEENLVDEYLNFQNWTALRPFVYFCTNESTYSKPQYWAYIAAVGESLAGYYSKKVTLYGRVDDKAAFSKKVYSSLKSQGYGVSSLAAYSTTYSSNVKMLVRYFSDSPLSFAVSSIGTHETSEDCGSEIAYVEKALRKVVPDGMELGLFCYSSAYIYMGTFTQLGLYGLDTTTFYDNSYSDFDECVQNRENSIKEFDSKYPEYDVYASICSNYYGYGSFRPVIIHSAL